MYHRLELSDIVKELLHNKVLIAEGQAGIGKSQLFANQAVSLLKANEDALLILGSDCLTDIPQTYVLYNREYPWSSGSKPLLEWQWKNIELLTGETKLIEVTEEDLNLFWLDNLLDKYSVKI